MSKINFFIIPGLVALAFLVLSYKLDSVPPGVYVDEVVTAVNANSILLTGKDEYGKSFPVLFRFFGSYSPPLYTYLTALSIFFLGINEFSARITSVICGALMVIVIYQFLKNSGLVDKRSLIYLSALFIITPWNFFFARTGYEIYIGYFLYSLGLLFLWLSLENRMNLIFGFIFLSASLYGSHAQLYSVPVAGLLFLVMFYKLLNKNYLIFGLLLAFLIQIPRIMLLNTKAFLNKGDLFYLGEIINNADKLPFPDFISFPLSLAFSFFSRAVYYFSPEPLFLLSDPDPQRSIPELSVFYNWMVIPYILGLAVVFLNLKNNFIRFLLIMIVAAVIPPSLTKDPFSVQRALPLLLPLFLIVSFGISAISKKIPPKKFFFVSIIFLIFSLSLLWRSYFVLLPSERSLAWNYGYKELADYVRKDPGLHFVIEQGLAKPGYVELAFFLKTDPYVLQNAVDGNIKNDYYNLTKFNPFISFENIEMRNIVWEKDIYKKQILVADEIGISKNQANEHFLEEVFRINDPRGYPIFIGYSTNPQKKCLATNFNSIFCKKPDLNTMD